MRTKTWLMGSLAVAFTFAATGIGCFEDPATCDTICALPSAPPLSTCSSACTTTQTACTTAGHSSDFQAYLTCVANEGSYVAIDEGCMAQTALITSECGAAPPAPVDAGATPDAGDVSPPIEQLDAIAPPSEACIVGGACETMGTSCTIAGAGPCDSDERLVCDGALQFAVDSFPCTTSPDEGCGFGTSSGSGGGGGCSESCSCQDGLEVCTGDCPDGGPSDP
jgi:hypothetical protein